MQPYNLSKLLWFAIQSKFIFDLRWTRNSMIHQCNSHTSTDSSFSNHASSVPYLKHILQIPLWKSICPRLLHWRWHHTSSPGVLLQSNIFGRAFVHAYCNRSLSFRMCGPSVDKIFCMCLRICSSDCMRWVL